MRIFFWINKTKIAFICLSIMIAQGCVAGRDDFWGISYHTERQGVAVTHLLVKAREKILDENYLQKPDGSLSRFYRESFSGRMPHPDSLFVQWIEEDTGVIHEQQISLQNIIPSNMEDQRVTLVFSRSDVYVFLVHVAVPTVGHPIKEFAAPQIFPDPEKKPYTGYERPTSRAQP